LKGGRDAPSCPQKKGGFALRAGGIGGFFGGGGGLRGVGGGGGQLKLIREEVYYYPRWGNRNVGENREGGGPLKPLKRIDYPLLWE